MNSWLLFPLAAFAACSSCEVNSKSTDYHPKKTKQEVLSGEALFVSNCVSCHGIDGRLGSGGAGILPETDLNRSQIIRQMIHGKGAMPSFQDRLTLQEMAAIADHVCSLKTSTP